MSVENHIVVDKTANDDKTTPCNETVTADNVAVDNIATTGKVLGSLFYHSPSSLQVQPLVEWFSFAKWQEQWPYGTVNELSAIAALLQQGLSHQSEPLEEAFQRLFIGPYALPAPPWGSVYLDPECVIFGDSTLALRQWMRDNAIEWHSEADNSSQGRAEPEDHIGLMLMMTAWLAAFSADLLDDFLAAHLLTWSGRYLELMEQGAQHSFYQGIAQLTRLTLDGWSEQRQINAVSLETYR